MKWHDDNMTWHDMMITWHNMTWHDMMITWHDITWHYTGEAVHGPQQPVQVQALVKTFSGGVHMLSPDHLSYSFTLQHTQLTCIVYIAKQLQLSFYKFSNHIVQSVLQCHLVLALIFLLKRNLVFSLKRNRGFQVQNTMKPKVWLLIWLSSHRVADCLVQVCAQSGHSLVGIVDSGHHVLEGFLAVICGWKSW